MSSVCHILYVFWQMLSNINVNVTYLTEMTFLSPVCHILYGYDKCCLMFVPSLSHLTSVMTNFVQFLSPVCHISPMLWQILSNFCPGLSHFLDFYTFFMHKNVYFGILSYFCHIFWHMWQILSHFQHLRNPVIPRVSAIGQKFVTFFKILSPVCHVFVTSINRVVMRFIHKIYINVTNIYKSLTKFF